MIYYLYLMISKTIDIFCICLLKMRQAFSDLLCLTLMMTTNRFAVVGSERSLPSVWRLKDCRVIGRLQLSPLEVILISLLLLYFSLYLSFSEIKS